MTAVWTSQDSFSPIRNVRGLGGLTGSSSSAQLWNALACSQCEPNALALLFGIAKVPFYETACSVQALARKFMSLRQALLVVSPGTAAQACCSQQCQSSQSIQRRGSPLCSATNCCNNDDKVRLHRCHISDVQDGISAHTQPGVTHS